MRPTKQGRVRKNLRRGKKEGKGRKGKSRFWVGQPEVEKDGHEGNFAYPF